MYCFDVIFFVSACSPPHIRTRILYNEQISFCYHPISDFGLKETTILRVTRRCLRQSHRESARLSLHGGAFESAAKRSYCIRQISHFAVSLTRPTKTFSYEIRAGHYIDGGFVKCTTIVKKCCAIYLLHHCFRNTIHSVHVDDRALPLPPAIWPRSVWRTNER